MLLHETCYWASSFPFYIRNDGLSGKKRDFHIAATKLMAKCAGAALTHNQKEPWTPDSLGCSQKFLPWAFQYFTKRFIVQK